MVRPSAFRLLWAVVGLVVAGGMVAAFATVPEYATGTALVVLSAGGDGTVVGFVPASSLQRLRSGQEALVWRRGDGRPTRLRVVAVDPVILSPDAVRARYGAAAAAAADVTGPVARVTVPLDLPGGAARYAGSSWRLDVAVGTRRLVSFARRQPPPDDA